MKWIEFVGPSGVGKTTFFNKLLAISDNKRSWVTLSEGLWEATKLIPNHDIKYKLIKLYLNQSLFNYKKEDYLLRRIENINIDVNSNFSPYVEIFFDFVAKLEISAIEKNSSIQWFLKNVKKLTFLEQYKFSRVVLMDEGLFNNTPNMKDKRWSDVTVFPEACFFFHLDINSNIEFIRKRADEGIMRNIHDNKTEDELKQYIESDLEMFAAKREFAIKKDIPILDIQVNDNPENNLLLIQNFLGNRYLY